MRQKLEASPDVGLAASRHADRQDDVNLSWEKGKHARYLRACVRHPRAYRVRPGAVPHRLSGYLTIFTLGTGCRRASGSGFRPAWFC